jgi:hypothetical protein
MVQPPEGFKVPGVDKRGDYSLSLCHCTFDSTVKNPGKGNISTGPEWGCRLLDTKSCSNDIMLQD